MSFQTNGYQLVEAISSDTAKLLATEFEIVRDNIARERGVDKESYMGCDQVEKSFAWYGTYGFEALLLHLKPLVEQVTGKRLYPTYNFARMYYNGATMAVHRDRPSCQYSATITIDVDETGPWEIWMENKFGDCSPVSIPVGSMLVYCGDKLAHWREEYKGKRQIQAFLHYVDADGQYADFKYDKRPMLGAERL
jgi:hypothetical protein